MWSKVSFKKYSLYDFMRLVRNSSSTRYFEIIDIRFFAHSTLSLLVLSGVGNFNKPITLSFLEVLHLGKVQFPPGFLIFFFQR